MFPELFSIGSFTLHSYGLMLAMGFIVALLLLKRIAKILQLDPELITDAATGSVIAGIVGARLLYVLINLNSFIASPLSIFYLWEGGLVFFGGLIGGGIWLLYFAKKSNIPLLKFLDVFSPVLPLAHGFGRIGCFLAGCCWGKSTESFIGVRFTHPKTLCGTNLPVHPVQLYSAFFLCILSYILYRYLIREKSEHGSSAALYFIGYGVFRFFVEFLRGDDRGSSIWGFSPSQVMAIFLVGLGLFLFWKIRRDKA